MRLIYEPAGRAGEYASLALNLYTGCAHGCTYCYAPSVCRVDRASFHRSAAPRKGVLQNLERELARDKRDERPPVLLCFTSDPYQPVAIESGVTRRAIELLHEYGYPVHVLSKAGTAACTDFDIIGQHQGDAYAATLTFMTERDSATWEPNAAPPADRVASLWYAHEHGLQTWASIEPVIDPAQSLELIRLAAPFVDLFKVGRWNHDHRADAIDWRAFARDAVALLDELGAAYYLKQDLCRFM
ncbi:MAG: hypothetical protein ABFC80_10030 [Coriobacteriales bacterium]